MYIFLNKIKYYPITTATIYSGVKNGLADIIVQEYIEKNEKINIRRTGVFMAFAFCYGGLGQYYMINKIMPKLFPGLLEGKLYAAVKGLIFDQTIHFPFIYLPIFYTFSELKNKNYISIMNIKKNWKKNIKNDMLLQCSLFIPIQFFNFTIVPPYLRVPFLTCGGFFYAIGLSYMRN